MYIFYFYEQFSLVNNIMPCYTYLNFVFKSERGRAVTLRPQSINCVFSLFPSIVSLFATSTANANANAKKHASFQFTLVVVGRTNDFTSTSIIK